MVSLYVTIQIRLVTGDVATQVTREWPLLAQAVNVGHVLLEWSLGRHFLAANRALKLSMGIVAALSMRRAVMSADRWLVAEHQAADLTLDTGGPYLKQDQI